MRKQHKCRLCDFKTLRWTDLEDHVAGEHTDYYNKVQKWLYDTNEKELLARKLAKDGLLGRKPKMEQFNTRIRDEVKQFEVGWEWPKDDEDN